ncbi:hypothetical protein AB434_2149 [Heyndrickxia coagulans]|nr:hypothetical protein AB434_2149 [Heyndrickxia coagulans]
MRAPLHFYSAQWPEHSKPEKPESVVRPCKRNLTICIKSGHDVFLQQATEQPYFVHFI